MTGLAGVTALAPDVYFAATLSREEATGLICVGITQTPFQGTHRVTVTGFAGVKGTEIFLGISMEERLAELTVAPSCVVLTRVTHTSTHIAGCQIQGHVKVTTAGMPMALAFLAGMGVPRLCCMPWVVLVQVLAALTVGTSCVMAADTKAMHHAFHVGWSPRCRPALRGMAMAQAAASGHKLIEGIVVERMSLEVPRGPVTQCVQFGEVHTEVSHMQELLSLGVVWVLHQNGWVQNFENYLALGGRLNV